MQPNTDDHDIEVKSNQARRFLEDGDKVKLTVRLRGRQNAHPDIGIKLLTDMSEMLRDIAQVEQRPQHEGRAQSMVLAPAPKGSKRSERPVQQAAPAPSAQPAAQGPDAPQATVAPDVSQQMSEPSETIKG